MSAYKENTDGTYAYINIIDAKGTEYKYTTVASTITSTAKSVALGTQVTVTPSKTEGKLNDITTATAADKTGVYSQVSSSGSFVVDVTAYSMYDTSVVLKYDSSAKTVEKIGFAELEGATKPVSVWLVAGFTKNVEFVVLDSASATTYTAAQIGTTVRTADAAAVKAAWDAKEIAEGETVTLPTNGSAGSTIAWTVKTAGQVVVTTTNIAKGEVVLVTTVTGSLTASVLTATFTSSDGGTTAVDYTFSDNNNSTVDTVNVTST